MALQSINRSILTQARVVANLQLCHEHYQLVLRVDGFPPAAPGQFVQLSPESTSWNETDYVTHDWPDGQWPAPKLSENQAAQPLLPRAFSIGGLRRSGEQCEIDVIYRVVGVATTWMASLRANDKMWMLGPLGQPFPVINDKQHAWLVAGGVGLPPLLWLAEALAAAGKRIVFFFGARTRELIPLKIHATTCPDPLAHTATLCIDELNRCGAACVLCTDDGSLGMRGHVVQALQAYHQANPVEPRDLVVYTCGPERMMRSAAEYCVERQINCQVCMERPMACGTGTCQSCIVTVKSDRYASGLRYALCCTEGPIFDARQLIWND